jgi:hypothetical protein
MQHPDAFYRGCAVEGAGEVLAVVLMRGLYPLWRRWQIVYFKWALAEIHPLHEDVPLIVCKLNILESQA